MISARGVGCRFPGGGWGLRDVSLDFPAASFTLVAGRNGSGKTLLTRLLSGARAPDAGTIEISGSTASITELRDTCALVFQDADGMIVGQSVEEDLRFGLENIGAPPRSAREAAAAMMRRIGLTGCSETPPSSLSGGEKRRLAIGGAALLRPQVLILDEPFANLDYPGVSSVLRLILDLHASGCTIILVSHELEKCLAHADQLVILDGGQVMAAGEPAQVVQHAFAHGLHPVDFSRLRISDLTWLNPGEP